MASAAATTETRGADLRARREAAGVSQSQVARSWPCSATNIQLIEGAARVTASRRARYLEALARAAAPVTIEEFVTSFQTVGDQLADLVDDEAGA